MNLVRYINKKCPAHSHCHCHYSGFKKNNLKECPLCNEEINMDFNRTCINYLTSVTIEKSIVDYIYFIFTNKYKLPKEIIDIIMNFANPYYIKKPILLNKEGIDHMMHCKYCVRFFLLWIDKNSCSHHILPRFKEKKFR